MFSTSTSDPGTHILDSFKWSGCRVADLQNEDLRYLHHHCRSKLSSADYQAISRYVYLQRNARRRADARTRTSLAIAA